MSDFVPYQGRPIDVEGGLRARSKRGAIGQSWWSGGFLEVLGSSLGGRGRLDRGKHYARRGQVIDLDIGAGTVTATVQGSRARPYRARLELTVFQAAQWAEIESALAQRAWYSTKLPAGEMPDDIEDGFSLVGLSLFAVRRRDRRVLRRRPVRDPGVARPWPGGTAGEPPFAAWDEITDRRHRRARRPAGAILDELPALEATVRGESITDLLRSAHR